MKRTLRLLMAPLWWASAPLRRALMAGFDARIIRLVSWTIEVRLVPPILEAISASDSRLDRIETLIARTDRSASKTAEDLDVVLDGLSREIYRLRAQVERLQEADDRSGLGGLSIVSETEDEPPAILAEVAVAGRSRVG